MDFEAETNFPVAKKEVLSLYNKVMGDAKETSGRSKYVFRPMVVLISFVADIFHLIIWLTAV